MLRQPKWGHLRDLHRAIKQAEPALVSGDPTIQSLGNYEKVNIYILLRLFLFPHDNGIPNIRKHQQIFMDGSIVSGVCLQVKEWSLCCIPIELPHKFCCESQVQWASL